MAAYNENDTAFKGSVDIQTVTIIPQFTLRNQLLEDGYFQVDKAGVFAMQLYSADLSAPIDWALEISLDGVNWAAAKDATGTEITGSITAGTAVLEVFRVQRHVKARLSLTVSAQTGIISYIIKPGDNEN